MRQYRIDGRLVKDIPSLCETFERAVGGVPGTWGHTLFAFDDHLFGGYGLVAPCEIVWEHHEVSKRNLDANALIRWCDDKEEHSPQDEDPEVRAWLADTRAKAAAGVRTLFDVIVEGIRSVSSRSGDASWRVDLTLT